MLLLKRVFPRSSEWWMWHQESLQRVGVFFLHATVLVPFPTGELIHRPEFMSP